MNDATVFSAARRLVATLLIASLAACGPTGSGGGGGENQEPADHTEFRQLLTEYNRQTEVLTEASVDFMDSAIAMNELMLMDEWELVDQEMEKQGRRIEEMEASIQEMQQLDNTIAQHLSFVERGQQPLLTWALAIATLAGFIAAVKQAHAQNSEGYDEQGEALAAGDPEAYDAATRKRKEAGEKVINELGKKVATDLVLSPANPTSTGGILLKQAAGDVLDEGLDVLSATSECENGYEDPGCKIGFSETKNHDGVDGTRAITVSDDEATVVIAGDDVARVVIEGIDTRGDGDIPERTVREQIPIDEATPTNVSQNDAGTYTPPSNNTTPNNTTPNNTTPNNTTPNNTNPNNSTAQRFPPNDTWYGMEIEYTVEGATLGEPSVSNDGDFNIQEYEMGTVTADTVVITGTITSWNYFSGESGTAPYGYVSVVLSDNATEDRIEEESGSVLETWRFPFRVELPVGDATVLTFSIAGAFEDRNEGIKTLSVQGFLTNF